MSNDVIDQFLSAVRAASAADGRAFCGHCGVSIGNDGARDADVRTIHLATCQGGTAAAARAAELQARWQQARASVTTNHPQRRSTNMQERNAEVLQGVVSAAQTARETKAARDEAIRAARREGYTLREISDASGLANQTIRRICGQVASV